MNLASLRGLPGRSIGAKRRWNGDGHVSERSDKTDMAVGDFSRHHTRVRIIGLVRQATRYDGLVRLCIVSNAAYRRRPASRNLHVNRLVYAVPHANTLSQSVPFLRLVALTPRVPRYSHLRVSDCIHPMFFMLIQEAKCSQCKDDPQAISRTGSGSRLLHLTPLADRSCG